MSYTLFFHRVFGQHWFSSIPNGHVRGRQPTKSGVETRRRRALRVNFDGVRDHRSPIVRLPPALSWAAPSHLGVSPPTSAAPEGREPDEPRQHGVGFAVRNTLLAAVEPPTGGTERLLSLRLSTDAGHVNILSVYAPTLKSPEDKKDKFYEQLHEMVASCQKDEQLFLLGDFNARVGTDHESWPTCLGHHGRMNGNGQRLLELWSYHNLCITNYFFQCKLRHNVSWEHPRFHHWHQFDLIITRRTALNSVLLTRSYHSADCDTDHALVSSRVHFQPRTLHLSRPKGRPRINVAHMSLPNRVTEYVSRLDQALQQMPHDAHGATTRWKAIQDVIHKTAIATFGRKARPRQDWFDANIFKMEPLIEAKRRALLSYKRCPSDQTLTALRTACNSAKRAARTTTGGNSVQGYRKVQSPETYEECTMTSVSDSVLNTMEELSILEELDAVPTVEELSIAIDSLPCRTAPGSDNIPPEAIKQGISLLNVVGKLYARIHLNRLKILDDRVYPESQCGFRANRPTTDMISRCSIKHTYLGGLNGAGRQVILRRQLPASIARCRPRSGFAGLVAYSGAKSSIITDRVWKDRVPSSVILQKAKIQSIYSILSQRRLRWLGHVRRMEDGRIPKDVLYGQLTSGSGGVGRPALRYKDICKRDMKSCGISTDTWEAQAEHRAAWRGVADADKRRGEAAAEKRRLRKAVAQTAPLRTHHTCGVCRRVCKTKAGLSSHMRSHQRRQDRLNCQRGI
ncbi:hypothetical protein Bbelb_276020 [Branchiostoma belcheri]|nr:hypothetical protein Bbelb_276020 [Branchiostoma belcheri]